MKQTAIVTGGTRGIGRGVSLRLAESGFNVLSVGTRPADDENVAQYLTELKKLCPCAEYVQGDISNETDRINIIDTAYEKFGHLDILVNNAGVAPKVRADLLEMTEESYDYVMNINLKGAFFLTQYAAKRMICDKTDAFRAIIFITSISADTSSINRGEYCISKAGLSMAVKLFAHRLADDNINVYEVRPGIIETDMTSGVHQKYVDLIEGGLLPIKRMGKPSDVAETVNALVSGAMAYSTGDVYNVDGGFYLRRL